MIYNIKTILLGDSGVGKTSIVLRFVNNIFNPYSESTIGASFFTKVFYNGDKTYKFHIWDTAGQEKYSSLASMYYRNAKVIIIVYDITNKNTFNTVKKWVKELNKNMTSDFIIAIIGNKNDLKDKKNVSTLQAKAYADEINAIFLETSAKNSSNIQELFETIINKIPDNFIDDIQNNIVNIHSTNNNKKNNCC